MSRISLKPKPNFAMAKDLAANFEELVADYWVLEGQFGNSALFKSANFNISGFDETISVAYTIAERIKQGDHGCIPEFEELTSFLEEIKRELTQLRIRLEGPSQFNYRHKVRYQIIGNQPNPNQIGFAPAPVNHRKSARAVVKTRKAVNGDMTSSSKRDPGYVDDDAAASSLLALGDGSKGKGATKLPSLESKDLLRSPSPDVASSALSFIPIKNPFARPVSLDAKDQEIARLQTTLDDVTQKRRETISNFNKTIASMEEENTDLENRNRTLALAYTQLRQDNEAITAEKDAIIARKDMLIAQYKKYLAVHEAFLDDATGELILGSIGKRGMVEDYEDARVRDLKKRKVNLHAEVDELEEYKAKLMADMKALESKKASDESDLETNKSAYYRNAFERASRMDTQE